MHSKERQSLLDSVVETIKNTVYHLPEDVIGEMRALNKRKLSKDQSRNIDVAITLYEKAEKNHSLYCKIDTGIPVFYIKPSLSMPKDLPELLKEAVILAHDMGYLIPSVVDPFGSSEPKYTGEKIPFFIFGRPEGTTTDVLFFPNACAADKLTLIWHLKPPLDNDEVIGIVRDTIALGEGRPCQPIVVGIGIGGSSDASMILSKQALVRKIGSRNDRKDIADLEKVLISSINADGVGVGAVALDVHIEYASCHRVVCPISVSIMCRAARRSLMHIGDSYQFSIG